MKCKDKIYQAHRTLVCRKSDVLKAALLRTFQVYSQAGILHCQLSPTSRLSMQLGSHNNALTFDDDDPKTVERMLMLYYTDAYNDTPPAAQLVTEDTDGPKWKISADAYRMLVNVSVFTFADKYAMLSLKVLVKSKFKALVNILLVSRVSPATL